MLRRIISVLLILCLSVTVLPALAEDVSLPPVVEETDDFVEIADLSEQEIVSDDPLAEDVDIYGEEAPDETGEEAAAAYTPGEYAVLQRGDRDGTEGASVAILQGKLIEVGFLQGAADGTYGGDTENAVKAFQRNNGLEETGIADSVTQAMLFTGKDIVTAFNSMDPENVTLRVQIKMAQWGFSTDTPDGVLGKATKETLQRFEAYMQEYFKLHPTPTPVPVSTEPTPVPLGFDDGEIALDTPIEQPEEEDVKITDMMLDFVDGKYVFDTFRKNVVTGDSNDEVWRVQRRMHNLNYLAVCNGTFDENSERALLYFQKMNELPQTGVADEMTQRRLFADDAVRSEEFINQYKLVVDISDQRVYVYRWDGSAYSQLIGKMKCSTGLKGRSTATPLGTYVSGGPLGGQWYWFKDYNCYAQYATRIVGGILFHSVIYSRGKVRNRESVRKLGRPASHGCVRLLEEHAQWIHENCPEGTVVVIQQ